MAVPQNQVLVVLFFLLLLQFTHKTTCEFLENVKCGSYPDVVPTDPITFRYHPIYVSMHTCKGADVDGLAASKACIPDPTKCQNVDIDVINVHTQQHEVLTLMNETDCVYKCNLNHNACSVFEDWNEDTCRCDCRFIQGEGRLKAPLCQPKHRWDYTLCKCVCMEERHGGENGCEPAVVPNLN